MAGFPGIAHVAVTVSDLSASVRWYQRLFGSDPVLDEDADGFHHTVFLLDGGALFGLHGHPGKAVTEPFSEFRAGLDHVSFACADRSELERWKTKLDELGIENGGIVDASYGSGVSFRDPDNIALEFFCPPS
jgi:glyoxylase I family protein